MFEVLVDGHIVGSTRLEHDDAPMGVAFGAMQPLASYAQLAHRFDACRNGGLSGTGVTVRIEGSAECLECLGAGIQDYTAELPDEPISVEVVGIPYPLYEQLFPHHVAAYKARF